MPEHTVMKFSSNIILVGIDFIGKESVKHELIEVVKYHDPDTLALALCEKRFETMMGREEWSERPLLPQYKEGQTGTLIYQAFIDAINENLRIFRDVEPESHIAQLVPLIEDLDMDVEFIDRDVTLTLSRMFKSMSPLEKMRMFWYFKSSMLTFSDKTKSDSIEGIEEHDDLIDGVLSSVERFAPESAKKARLERIEYSSKKIYELSRAGKVVAILPRSQLTTVASAIRAVKRREQRHGEVGGYKHLEEVSKRIYTKVLRFISPAFFISLAVYLFFFSDVLNIWRAWLYWFLAVGGMAALGATLARGHPFSIIASFFLAPFMSLTLIGPGWVAGYIELKIRNPKVADIKGITSSGSANAFLSNNVIKVFTVGVFSNVFTWMGLFIVLPILIRFVG